MNNKKYKEKSAIKEKIGNITAKQGTEVDTINEKNDKRKREEKHMTTTRIKHNSSTSAVEKVMKSAPTCTTGSVEPVSGRRTVSSIHRGRRVRGQCQVLTVPFVCTEYTRFRR